jgi:hypothetical protein
LTNSGRKPTQPGNQNKANHTDFKLQFLPHTTVLRAEVTVCGKNFIAPAIRVPCTPTLKSGESFLYTSLYPFQLVPIKVDAVFSALHLNSVPLLMIRRLSADFHPVFCHFRLMLYYLPVNQLPFETGENTNYFDKWTDIFLW